MGMDKRLCVICAWRQHCQKRFSVAYTGVINIHCPDFTRDYTIKDLEEDARTVERQLEKWRRESLAPPRPCLTVSREPGAGGSEIARKLARDLNMDLMGGQIISRVAESARMSEKVVKTLDEKHVSTLDSWINSLFTARHLSPDVYLRHLTNVIATIGEHGNAVIVGRGAQFILPPERTFRLRLIAPREQRIEKVRQDRNCPREEAEEYVSKTENNRAAFIKKNFHEDIAASEHYDLVLNTGGMTVDEATAVVENAFKSRKL